MESFKVWQIIIIVIVAMTLGTLFLMFFWNWLIVGIFPTLPTIDFWKSLGLYLLLCFVGQFFKK